MASVPPTGPESIVLTSFGGIKNTVSEERLGQGDLASAVNVDLDDVGQLRRRRGYTRVSTAMCHSLMTLGDVTLVVKDGVLGRLYPDYSFKPLSPVGPTALCYVRVADTIFYSSASGVSGKITNDEHAPWGEFGAGMWVSPVLRPTETLGAIRGKLLTGPPAATCMDAYKGRIYLGHERLIWATELYLYDKVDAEKNFIQTEADVTMIAAVDKGLFIGTTAALHFLQGTLADGLKMRTVINSPVIPGSLAIVPYAKALPQARQGPVPEGYGPMFMTAGGVLVGLDNGDAFNLTQDRVVFPGVVRAAALYREDQGANAYVAVTDSAGGPSANARIGDYVDAEIVRASQRG